MPDIDRPKHSPLHTTAWMLTATLMLARLLPAALQPGMFFDGVTHATIARNMAAGEGDFWHPVLFGPKCDYHEQPTLAFWLESLLFRVLGDHFWVEKLYSAMLAIGTAAIIAGIWRQLLRDRPELRDCSWLPVALWALLAKLGVDVRQQHAGKHARLVRAGQRVRIASGREFAAGMARLDGGGRAELDRGRALEGAGRNVSVDYAAGDRGHPAARQASRMLVIAEGLLLFFLLGMGLLMLQHGAHEYLTTYFHDQVVSSLTGQREFVHSRLGRLNILWQMAGQLIVPALAAVGLIAWARRRCNLGQPP